MPMIGKEKLIMAVLVGGVSEMVRLSIESPPPPPPPPWLFSPLQELSANANVVETTSDKRDFLEFISRTPRQD